MQRLYTKTGICKRLHNKSVMNRAAALLRPYSLQMASALFFVPEHIVQLIERAIAGSAAAAKAAKH